MKYVDIDITKTSDESEYYRDDIVTYTIDFANNGTITTTGVEIYDRLFSGLQYISHYFT